MVNKKLECFKFVVPLLGVAVRNEWLLRKNGFRLKPVL